MLEIVIYAFVFAGAFLLLDLVLEGLLGLRNRTVEVNYRLKLLKQNKTHMAAYSELLRSRGLGAGNSFDFFLGAGLGKLFTQSGLRLGRKRWAVYLLLAFVISWVFWTFFLDSLVWQIALTVISGSAVSIGLVLYLRSKRINKVVSQLADAIDVIVRSLSAGHPLHSAISLVAKEMPDPIGSEFGILSDQLTYGANIDDAMLDLVHRVGAEELKLLAVTVTVQRGTGGNLGEILESLSEMIRARYMIKAKIWAISTEGRITAVIMSIFPFFLFFMIRTLVPSYFDPLWETGYGTIVVATCSGFMLLGIIILYRLVKFDF